MAKAEWVEPLYPIAERFRDNCLIRDGSLFFPERSIWTLETIDDFETRFVEDTSKGNFDSKLKKQLANASDETAVLAGEVYFANLLAESDSGAPIKQEHVDVALSFAGQGPKVPAELATAFSNGIATLGQARNQRDKQFRFILELARQVKAKSPKERAVLFSDPWAYREFQSNVATHGASYQREAFLHLFFPDVFESVVSADHKQKIIRAFAEYLDSDQGNVDEKLLAIRNQLVDEYGEGFHFYEPELRPRWDTAPASQRAWIVRGERAYGANLVPRWLEEGFVSMGAADEGRIEPGMSVKQIIDLVHQARPEMTRQQIRGGATSGRYFASEISVGDYVLTRDGESVYVGRVASDQEFVPDDQAGTARRRQVEWLNRDEPLVWGELPKGLRERATNPNTVWELKGQVAAIEQLIDSGAAEEDALWEPFLHWASRLYEPRESFDAEERDYKLVIAAHMAEAREALEAGDDSWPQKLKRAFGPPNNLTSYFAHGPFLDECANDPATAAAFLSDLWSSASLDAETVSKADEAWFDASRTNRSPANRLSILAVLFMAVDPKGYPPYRFTAIDKAMGLLGVPKPDLDGYDPTSELRPEDVARALGVPGSRVRDFLRQKFERAADMKGAPWPPLTPEQLDALFRHFGKPAGAPSEEAGRRYSVFLDLLDEFMERMAARQTPLRDRLDAQGLLWGVTSAGPPGEWSAEDKAAFLAYQGGRKEEVVETDLRVLSQELFLEPAEWLEEVVELLLGKRQAIFFGPPGTGKTYVAQALAEHLTRDGGAFELIQFHPSYSYEDFFEGYRPRTEDGQLSYVLTPGPLRLMAARAQADPANPYVLIVDEINRGNIPKIFGELLFLLEYRKREIALQFSADERFSLPPNLYLIGTMNTADRSIALVDAALRRRFYFVEFSPNEEPVRDVLRLWLEKHGLDTEPDVLLRELNERIAQNDIAIGPSYFMTPDGSQPDLDRLWKHSITPLLEEYFYDARSDIEMEYGLAALRLALRGEGETSPEPQPEAEPEEDASPVA